MKIHFSELYVDTFSAAAPKRKVSDTLRDPDKCLPQQLDDQRYELFAKKFTRVTRKAKIAYYVWVMCQVNDDVYDVNTALIVPSALRDGIDSMDPLEMLKVLIEEFGVVIKTQYKTDKLIHHETFWHEGNAELTRVFGVQPPPHTKGVLSGWVKIEPHGQRSRVQSHFVFCLNLTEYESRLKSLGM